MPIDTYSSSRYPAYIGASPILEHSKALTAATATTAGAVVSILNPFGFDVIILDAILDITTAATTAANTIDMGVAAGAATASDTLLDGRTTGVQVSSARGQGGTNGLTPRKWGAAEYVTATASATLVGMVGNVILLCVKA